MIRVFVSHSSVDRAFVEEVLIPLLRSNGISPWYSKDDILTAETYEVSIRAALRDCDWFAVVLSPDALRSRWVKAETHVALEDKKGRVVPILYRDCDPKDLHLLLSTLEYVDFRQETPEARARLLAVWDRRQVDGPPREPDGPSGGVDRPGGVRVPRFHHGGLVPPDCFVDRVNELAEGRELIAGQQSFLLVGDFRAGKTSYGKMLIHQLMGPEARNEGRVLGSYLNLQQCRDLSPETFLEHTVINIIGEIARLVFNCKYSDLIGGTPTRDRPDLAGDSAFQWFFRIYKLIRERTHPGESRQGLTLRLEDFVAFINESMEIVRSKGWRHFFIFYDEANRLPIALSADMLVANEEALHSAGIVSVYSAIPRAASMEPFDTLFGHQIHLRPFASIDDLRTLLARYCHQDDSAVPLPVSERALAALWEFSGGRPYHMQLLAGSSFAGAHRQGDSRVHQRHVLNAYELLKNDPRFV